MQILRRDEKGNLRPNRGIAVAQRITINWEKDEIQRAYPKDTRVKELRKQKWTNDNVQERKGILYWKEWIYLLINLQEGWAKRTHEYSSTGHPGIGKTTELVAQDYYFLGITQMVKKIVKEYDKCNWTKHDWHVLYGKLQPIKPFAKL